MAKDEKHRGNNGVKKRGFNFSALPMELESELKKFLSGYADKMKEYNDFVDSKKNASDSGDRRNVDSCEELLTPVQGENGDHNMVNDGNFVSRKRKRECYLEMLNWIRMVAKDPCNPVIGSLPETHEWKIYGTELHWKQSLLIRQAMLSQSNADASSQQSIWQKLQKMHPVMYEDQTGSQGLRYSQRIATAKDSSHKAKEMSTPESSSSGYQNDNGFAHKQYNSTADSFSFIAKREKKIPIGPHFQAELPKFVGTTYEYNSKCLGTRIWPLAKGDQIRSLIERDPIGKGRQESCGCQIPGSLECVRFHIRERRTKVKLELDSAFYLWKFDRMGEEVAFIWSKEDETKFSEIVNSNLLSMGKYFWEELFKIFPRKGREALVSYYFNVFLLRRRSDQNRNKNGKFDSDDDESEYGPIANRFGQKDSLSPGSIFRSPKRPHPNR